MKVVLIHGAGATAVSWATVVIRIPIAFTIPTYNIHEPFEKIMKDVEQAIDDKPTIVIGHSFGGIVAYHLAQKHKNIVAGMSIATPWSGSVMAQIGSMFWYGNQFFKNIGRYEDHIRYIRNNPINIPWTNIVTTKGLFNNEYDGVVSISSQRQLQSNQVKTIDLNYSHNEVLHSNELIYQIFQLIYSTD